MTDLHAAFAPWSSFYVMMGSSAAALTGLMFIVITLVMGTERLRKSGDGISAFSTPTVVHFGVALLISALLTAPWRSLLWPAALLALTGAAGMTYIIRVSAKTKSLEDYKADAEDWSFYSILPLFAYGLVLASAIMLPLVPVTALFVLAAGVALLVFIGIRNAWDIVTYIALGTPNNAPENER